MQSLRDAASKYFFTQHLIRAFYGLCGCVWVPPEAERVADILEWEFQAVVD